MRLRGGVHLEYACIALGEQALAGRLSREGCLGRPERAGRSPSTPLGPAAAGTSAAGAAPLALADTAGALS